MIKNKNIEDLLNKAKDLQKEFGDNITIGDIIVKLNIDKQNDKTKIKLKFEDLRDFLLANLIKILIKNKVIEKVQPETLNVLTKSDLKDILEEYIDSSYFGSSSSIEQNILYLFYTNGGNAFEYLQQCINLSINKWGVDKDINDFSKNSKDLSIDNIKCKWIYKQNCDDYDCYSQTGSIIELLKRKYRNEDMLEYATVKDLYNYMLSPDDLDEDNEFQWLDVKRISTSPTEIEFFLLLWKYFLEE